MIIDSNDTVSVTLINSIEKYDVFIINSSLRREINISNLLI